MARHNELGKEGEAIACKYLIEKGFIILEKNYRHEKDEVDLIALDKGELVFVEVKTRSTQKYGEPEEAVGTKKEEFLIRAAETFLETHNEYESVRFDIISIIISGNKQQVRHIKDAFYPE